MELRPAPGDPNRNEFGGFSGLEIDPADGFLIALTDRGWLVRIENRPPFRTSPMAPLGLRSRNPYHLDAEALRLAPDGRWWLAFERYDRLAVHRPDLQGLLDRPMRQFLLPAVRDLPGADGIESLAVMPDGRVVVIAEAAEAALMLVLDGKGRQLAEHMFASPFPPVDAVALADGGLLVLTRHWSWSQPLLFLTRLVHVAPGWETGRRVESRLLLDLNEALPLENYEGLALERGAGGGLQLWLVADDNFMPFQRSLLVRLDMPAECLSPGTRCEVRLR